MFDKLFRMTGQRSAPRLETGHMIFICSLVVQPQFVHGSFGCERKDDSGSGKFGIGVGIAISDERIKIAEDIQG